MGEEREGGEGWRGGSVWRERRSGGLGTRRLALAETVVAVMDGAGWLQGFADFPHAVEYLARASHEALGVAMAATEAATAWLTRQAHALKHDGPDPVLAALRALPTGAPRGAALAYLEPRLAQLQYPTFRAAGYPIGSGLVEGANKVVVEDRLKGSGMHWAPASVDPVLALRTVVCADRLDEAWARICARLRADARARGRQRHQHAVERRAARAAAAPPTDAPAPPAPASRPVSPP